MWGNDVHGDCVTAEEAFAKACNNPEIFITDDEVIAWATKNGVLEGAYLTQVLTLMQNGGFAGGANTFDDGPYFSVDWTDAGTLQSAISLGPVKLGIAADQIDTAYSSTGGRSGWFATGFHDDANEDHCVSLCGYGSMSWLAQHFGVPVPAAVNGGQPGYAMFTWDSIGIIDVPSMVAITHEAWLRHPTTVIMGWSTGDIVAATGAPPATAATAVDGYQTLFNSQQHINYLTADGHVHELVYKDNWQSGDLTAAAGAPPAAPGSALDGYETAWNSQQHVNYLTADGHVHELVYKDNWQSGDLTAAAGAPPAAEGSHLDAYATTFNNQQHINYLTADGHVHELVYK
jgi:prepilin-type processing-associated H-X9-DG protein